MVIKNGQIRQVKQRKKETVRNKKLLSQRDPNKPLKRDFWQFACTQVERQQPLCFHTKHHDFTSEKSVDRHTCCETKQLPDKYVDRLQQTSMIMVQNRFMSCKEKARSPFGKKLLNNKSYAIKCNPYQLTINTRRDREKRKKLHDKRQCSLTFSADPVINKKRNKRKRKGKLFRTGDQTTSSGILLQHNNGAIQRKTQHGNWVHRFWLFTKVQEGEKQSVEIF